MQTFDDLLLMKIGGRIIYHGELGRQSSKLVAYFEVRSQGSGYGVQVEDQGLRCCQDVHAAGQRNDAHCHVM